jgi:hypothetical protein
MVGSVERGEPVALQQANHRRAASMLRRTTNK